MSEKLTLDLLMKAKAKLENELGPNLPPTEVWVSNALKPGYMREVISPLGRVLLMSRDTFEQARTMKHEGGMYVLQPAPQLGRFDTLLGLPILYLD